jgi:tellurium resistance protein TerD
MPLPKSANNISYQENSTEIARYDLSEDASIETGMIFGEIYRVGADWKFKAVG